MPAYNAEKTIKTSVESVVNQTFKDFEVIIVDDCSRDGTRAICEALAIEDSRIRILFNEVNKGVAASRNRGISEARGEWVAFLDSDDLWYPNKLGHEYDYILRAERDFTYDMLLRRNLMSSSSVVVRREILQKYKFPEGQLHEDYVVWLRIVQNTGTAYGLDEPLLVYRLSKTSRSGRRVRSGLMLYRSYRTVGYGVLQACLMTFRYAKYSLSKRRKMSTKISL
jgi:teichuronic acid biosynthesis glycosyltransferase TuaG